MAKEVFVVTSSYKLIAINTQTLKAREVGITSAMMTDVAFAPDGTLYGISFGALYTIDPKTAKTTFVGSLDDGGANALEIDKDGNAYIASSDDGNLYSVDLATGDMNLIGEYSSTLRSEGDLAMFSGNLYLTTTDKKILKLDVDTGKAISSVKIPVEQMYGLEQSGSTLYGFADNLFYSVDPTNGNLTAMKTVDGYGAFMGAASFEFSDPVSSGYTLKGSSKTDWLFGGKGDDKLYGRSGNDFLYGGAGKDRLYGEAGNDVLSGGPGADKLYGGKGKDTASYEGASKGVTASLAKPSTNKGDAKGDTYNSIENLTGSSYADRLSGDSKANVLTGGVGKDVLKGNSGGDTLIGGKGADALYGGKGKDVFVFKELTDSTAKTSGRDTIYDFSKGDRIDLKAIDADIYGWDNQAFSFIGSKGFTGDAGELRFTKKNGSTFIYADVDGDKKADFAIKVDKLYTFEKGDFLL